MASHELTFPGQLTPPDIQAYQQFSIQSESHLHRVRRGATPIFLDGIDGRLNPESFYVKSKSASSKRRQNLEYQQAHTFFSSTNSNALEFTKHQKESQAEEALTVTGREIKRSSTIQRAVEAYMKSNLMKNTCLNNNNVKEDTIYGSLIPEPCLGTWQTVYQVVQLLLEGRITWKQIHDNFKGQEVSQREIELFCELSPLQKRVRKKSGS